VVGEKLTNKKCSVTGCIVIVENPILRLPQTPQNFTVKLCADGLALGDEFAMNNAMDAEKHDEHGLL
jgi:hypothetical protein